MKDKIAKIIEQYNDRPALTAWHYDPHELAALIVKELDLKESTFSEQIRKKADGEFYGDTFNEKTDGKRLRKLQDTVEEFMSDERWHTLADIRVGIGRSNDSSISARLRDAGTSGRWYNEKKNKGGGLWVYRLRSRH